MRNPILAFQALQTESIGYAVSPTTTSTGNTAGFGVWFSTFPRQQPGFPKASYKTHLR